MLCNEPDTDSSALTLRQELTLIQRAVQSAALGQLVVCPYLHDPAMIEDQDHVRTQHGGKPVRDDQAGASAQ